MEPEKTIEDEPIEYPDYPRATSADRPDSRRSPRGLSQVADVCLADTPVIS